MIDCERRCNAQYMSLDPVRWENGLETVVHGTTFFGLENYSKKLHQIKMIVVLYCIMRQVARTFIIYYRSYNLQEL